MSDTPLLRVRNLRTEFRTRRGTVTAVDGVSFDVAHAEALAIVGESGSGKSATCLSIMRLLPRPGGRIIDGSVEFNGRDLIQVTEKQMAAVRGREISIITQDPLTSLDPLFSVGAQVSETLPQYARSWSRVVRLLEMVGIPAAAARAHNFPHQLSGGMRQRVVAAISLATESSLLIADEPTTALDVTIQLQFLNLLEDLRRERHLSLILVTHDLSIVARLCDRAAVMYAGRIVEIGSTRDVLLRPLHPYTEGLIRSIPRIGDAGTRLNTIEGQPPDLMELPVGCAFQDRCPKVMQICREEQPALFPSSASHLAACWLHASLTDRVQPAVAAAAEAHEGHPGGDD